MAERTKAGECRKNEKNGTFERKYNKKELIRKLTQSDTRPSK